MRVFEPLDKAGEFWLPETPEIRRQGRLSVADGGKVTLRLSGNLEGTQDDPMNLDVSGWERVVGDLEGNDCVTLLNTTVVNIKDSCSKFAQLTASCEHAFFGGKYGTDEEIRFGMLAFSVDGLEDWLGLSRLVKQSSPLDATDNKTLSISFDLTDYGPYDLGNGFKLEFSSNYDVHRSRRFSENSVNVTYSAVLTSEVEKPYEKFTGVARQLMFLFRLLMGVEVSLHTLTANTSDLIVEYQDRDNTTVSHVPVRIFYASRPFNMEVPEIWTHRMYASFNEIQSDLEAILQKWMLICSQSETALDIHFYNADYKYIEELFLGATRALEALHRTDPEMDQTPMLDDEQFEDMKNLLFETFPNGPERDWVNSQTHGGNRLNFRRRLKGLTENYIDILGGKEKTNILIDRMLSCRDLATHGEKITESDPLALSKQAELIFILNVFKRLGWDDVNRVAENFRRLNGILNIQP